MSTSTDSRSRTPGRKPTPPRRTPYRTARRIGIAMVVALVAVIAVVLVRGGVDGSAARTDAGPVVAPGNRTTDGWFTVGDGPVEVTVYFDYLCPACGAFEAANGTEIERLLEEGDITLGLRPLAFLDELSAGTEYSTRAANALATVVDADPQLAAAFHRALYANQPAEGGPGLTDDEIATIARDAGVPGAVADRFAEGRFAAWTAERTEHAFDEGVEGTPTILVDGELFTGDPYTPGPLTAAIEQAAR